MVNPFNMRNTIRGLEEKVEYFKLKQLRGGTGKPVVEAELRAQESSKCESSEKDTEF